MTGLRELFLSDAYVTCNECGGTGYDRSITELPNGRVSLIGDCKKCKGKGILDWIENIVGVKSGIRLKPGVYVRWNDEAFCAIRTDNDIA